MTSYEPHMPHFDYNKSPTDIYNDLQKQFKTIPERKKIEPANFMEKLNVGGMNLTKGKPVL